MAWYDTWLAGSKAQDFDEAQENLHREELLLAARLKQRLDAGTMSQKAYDDALYLTYENLESPSEAYWDAFQEEVAVQAKQLPTTIGNAIGTAGSALGNIAEKTAGAFAGAAGKAAGGGLRGLVGGFFGASGITGVVVIGGVIFLLWWAFTKGPLKDAKIKVIPV